MGKSRRKLKDEYSKILNDLYKALYKGEYSEAYEILDCKIYRAFSTNLFTLFETINPNIIKLMCELCETKFNRKISYEEMKDKIMEGFIRRNKFEKAYDLAEFDLPDELEGYEFYEACINKIKKYASIIDKKKLKEYVDSCLNKTHFTQPFIFLSAMDDEEELKKLANELVKKAREKDDGVYAYRIAIAIFDRIGEIEKAKELIKELFEKYKVKDFALRSIGLVKDQMRYKDVIEWFYKKNPSLFSLRKLGEALREEELIREYAEKLKERGFEEESFKYLYEKGVEIPEKDIIEFLDNLEKPPVASFPYELALKVGYEEWFDRWGGEAICAGVDAFILNRNREGLKELVKLMKKKGVSGNVESCIRRVIRFYGYENKWKKIIEEVEDEMEKGEGRRGILSFLLLKFRPGPPIRALLKKFKRF